MASALRVRQPLRGYRTAIKWVGYVLLATAHSEEVCRQHTTTHCPRGARGGCYLYMLCCCHCCVELFYKGSASREKYKKNTPQIFAVMSTIAKRSGGILNSSALITNNLTPAGLWGGRLGCLSVSCATLAYGYSHLAAARLLLTHPFFRVSTTGWHCIKSAAYRRTRSKKRSLL